MMRCRCEPQSAARRIRIKVVKIYKLCINEKVYSIYTEFFDYSQAILFLCVKIRCFLAVLRTMMAN